MKMIMRHVLPQILFFFSILLLPSLSFAAEFDGTTLSLLWGLPFLGILLSIAILPITIPKLWHHHFGKITAAWCILFLIPFGIRFGLQETVQTIAHALLAEYFPFIILLLSLFTVSGGIYIQGNLRGSPRLNVLILLIGTILASFMGTTGAAMLLIRPLLRANDHRKHKVHIVVFFIFLVANIGGSLTPLGDPPLFLGFLKGVNFFWTFTHLFLPFVITATILLAVFFCIDSYYYKKEVQEPIVHSDPASENSLKILGSSNFILLGGIIGCVLLSGFWAPEQSINILGTTVELQNIVRDTLLIGIAILSLRITTKEIHVLNEFNWEPILEVGKLFAGIFITIAPVLAILKAGTAGSMAGIIHLVTDESGVPINTMYFWMTGILSAFLDNAPTYLVFFNLSSGNAQHLMTNLSDTLLAISMGSVFMGACTYIGNAPNFMVKSLAIQQGVSMPSFFGYMKWSVSILIPVFLLLTLIFFI